MTDQLRALMAETAERYDSPGKRKERALVIAVAAKDCRTFLDTWGGGQSARAAVAAGLEVTSAERDRSLHGAMKLDAKESGFHPWPRSMGLANGMFDFVNFDICGGPSETTRRDLRKVVPHVAKWLAVWLSVDHQLDKSLTGPSALATVPVWVVEATGMSLVYASRYVRNTHNQTMWVFLLTPRDPALRGNQQLAPLTIARELRVRHYWATPNFRRRFQELVPHYQHSATERQRVVAHTRYIARRGPRIVYSADEIQTREKAKRERRRAYRRAWYLANQEGQIESARKWREAHPKTPRGPKTHCPSGHPYSGDNLGFDSQGYKQCLTCRREQGREARAKRRLGDPGFQPRGPYKLKVALRCASPPDTHGEGLSPYGRTSVII